MCRLCMYHVSCDVLGCLRVKNIVMKGSTAPYRRVPMKHPARVNTEGGGGEGGG